MWNLEYPNEFMKKNRPSEDAIYFKGIQERLAKLDHEMCIQLAQDLTEEANRRGEPDMSMCACNVEKFFGISKRDLYALADIDALKGEDLDECTEFLFCAKDIRQLIERSAELKAVREKMESNPRARRRTKKQA